MVKISKQSAQSAESDTINPALNTALRPASGLSKANETVVNSNKSPVTPQKKDNEDSEKVTTTDLKLQAKRRMHVPMMKLTAGFVLLVIFGAIGYLMTQIPKKAVSVQTLRTQVIATAMSEQDKLILDQVLKDSVVEREMLLNAFPDEEQMLEFITLIDEIKGARVEVLKFSVDSDLPTKVGNNSILPITLTLKGSVADVTAAFHTISNSPYFINPISVTQSWDASGEFVTTQTQFYLYVSNKFSNSAMTAPANNNRKRR